MSSRKLAPKAIAAAITIVAVATSSFAALGATGGWPGYQHDSARTGVDPDAPAVTGISAGWNTHLDEKMYAQPLVAGSLVYAATENNTVYALDVTSGAIAWQNHLAAPAALSQLPCGNINPYGITGTPVIDTANGVLYTAALVAGPAVHHELYALNLKAGGAVLYHFPIDAPGSDPLAHGQRGALSLASGKVYVPYSGRAGDCGTYVGRVVGVNAGDSTGASLVNYALPNTSRGGIWAAASADGSGNLYVATGNSNATGTTPDRGESVVKLSPALKELDYFTAPEWSSLNSSDTDIGSIGPTLLQNGWILQSGKSGMGYLLNSANLGHVGGQLFEGRICDAGQQAVGFGAYQAPNTVFIPCTSSLKAVHVTTTGTPGFTVTTVRAGYSGGQGSSPPIIAGGVLWNMDAGNRLLLGFNPSTGTQRFSQPLAGTPVHFAAPSSGAGHVFVPSGSILEAFTLSSASPPTPTPVIQATFTSHAVDSPKPVQRGSTLSIASTITATQASNVLIDVEIHDAASNKVFQQFWDNQTLVAGQPRTYTSAWQVPATAALGAHTTTIGVFTPGWHVRKSWNTTADSFSVIAASSPTPTPTPVARVFTSGASASPASIHPGGNVSLSAAVKSNTVGKALVDVEVYDASFKKVFQQYWDAQSFTAAGQTLTFNGAWRAPASTAPGTYTVMVGVFSPGWGTLYNWNSSGATFVVN
jgi:outer membrane protein assembly factor BamB